LSYFEFGILSSNIDAENDHQTTDRIGYTVAPTSTGIDEEIDRRLNVRCIFTEDQTKYSEVSFLVNRIELL